MLASGARTSDVSDASGAIGAIGTLLAARRAPYDGIGCESSSSSGAAGAAPSAMLWGGKGGHLHECSQSHGSRADAGA